MNKTKPCPMCAEYDVIQINKQEEYDIRGELISVNAIFYHCNKCNEDFETFDSPDTLEIAYRKYRDKKNLLQPEAIKEIRERYHLSQKDFSDILGIGIASLNRYENGALQTESLDNLIKVMRNPIIMLDIVLEKYQTTNNIKYETLSKSIIIECHASILKNLIKCYEYNFAQFKNVNIEPIPVSEIANYFLFKVNEEEEEGITNLKLQKLLYYTQALFLVLTGMKLFNDDIKAWQYGPVIQEVYEEYQAFGSKPITKPKTFILNNINNNQQIKSFLDYIYEIFGQFSAWKLSEMTHKEIPWIEAREKADKTISEDSIKIYFQKLLAL